MLWLACMKKITISVALLSVLISGSATAQTAKGASQVKQAYGARLTPVGPDDMPKVDGRAIRRLETRVNSRISTRIERYNITPDPTASLRAAPTDATAALRRQIAPIPQVTD